MPFKFSCMKDGCAHVFLAGNDVDGETAAAMAIAKKDLPGMEPFLAAGAAVALMLGEFGTGKISISGIYMEEITEQEMEQWQRVF